MFFNNRDRGGMLTGNEIKRQIKLGNIKIDPYDPECINPNSYNLKLHPQLLVYKRMENVNPITLTYFAGAHDTNPAIQSLNVGYLDMKSNNPTKEITIPKEGYILYPGVLYIGRTVEKTFTDKFIPMLDGRSSVGRLGMSIHICAGFGDIGFNGTWTLEITVVEPVKIYPYVEIAQVSYFTPVGKISKLYKGRYLGQEAATPSKFHEPKKG